MSPLGWRICSCTQVPYAAKMPQSYVDGVVGKIYLCGLDPPDGIYTTLGGSVLPEMATIWDCDWGLETLEAAQPPTPASHLI